jgi:hypothetical protein
MFKKGSNYFADWRDHYGRRKRKSFPTAKKALRYQARVTNEAAAKKARASAALQTSAKPGPRRIKKAGPATR